MFKLGEYCEEDLKPLVSYLKDAGFRVDMRPSLGAWKDSAIFLEGRLGEIRGLVEDIEKYERYLTALKSALSSGAIREDFKDRFMAEIDPSLKEIDELRMKFLDSSVEPSDEDKQKMDNSLEKLAEWVMAFDFAENTLSVNEIEIGKDVGEKLNDPILRIRVSPGKYGPDQEYLKRYIEIVVEKVYDVYVDEFSTPLFRDIDEGFKVEYYEEYLKILGMGLLIDDMVEDPSQGKIDLRSFSDRCRLELGGDKRLTMAIDASDVAEEIAKVLEKNGVIKIKGTTIKWKA